MLDVDGMSSDEEDRADPGRFDVIQKHWRSAELNALLRTLDLVYKYFVRAKSGSGVRHRLDGGHMDTTSTPTPCLPSNCYSPDATKMLTKSGRQALKRDAPLDLQVDEELILCETPHSSSAQADLSLLTLVRKLKKEMKRRGAQDEWPFR